MSTAASANDPVRSCSRSRVVFRGVLTRETPRPPPPPAGIPYAQIFWPLHPIFDRIWAFIRLSPHFEHFNHTWVDTHSCQGHDYHDVLPFKDLMNENSGHYYTNQELYQLFDPMNPELPYLYDNFDWGHCHTAALGHDAAHATDDTLREGGAQGTGDESIFWETQWE